MTPFLVESLEELLCGFYSKFIWPDILVNAKTTMSLLKIDVSNHANQLSTIKIDVCFSLKYNLQQLKSKGKIADVQIDKFKRGVCVGENQWILVKHRLILVKQWLIFCEGSQVVSWSPLLQNLFINATCVWKCFLFYLENSLCSQDI